MYIPAVINRGVGKIQFKNFFHGCRIEGVTYDLEQNCGT